MLSPLILLKRSHREMSRGHMEKRSSGVHGEGGSEFPLSQHPAGPNDDMRPSFSTSRTGFMGI